MSLYIPGIPMPKTCHECRFFDGCDMDGLCRAANRWIDDEDFWTWYAYAEDDIDTSKPCNCPLIEVPPHGRFCVYDGVIVQNDAEPTIIPADGADKENND